MTAARLNVTPYLGPECPRCTAPMTASMRASGVMTCYDCKQSFEATVFTPPARKVRVVEVAAAGPEGAAACANHARNAAVTSCERCGLFICSLCEMNAGAGSFCPTCFSTLRSEKSSAAGAGRTRDYKSSARVSMIVGLPFMALGWIFGGLAIYYAVKAFKQLRERGSPIFGLVVITIVAAIEVVVGLLFTGMMIWGIAQAL